MNFINQYGGVITDEQLMTIYKRFFKKFIYYKLLRRVMALREAHIELITVWNEQEFDYMQRVDTSYNNDNILALFENVNLFYVRNVPQMNFISRTVNRETPILPTNIQTGNIIPFISNTLVRVVNRITDEFFITFQVELVAYIRRCYRGTDINLRLDPIRIHRGLFFEQIQRTPGIVIDVDIVVPLRIAELPQYVPLPLVVAPLAAVPAAPLVAPPAAAAAVPPAVPAAAPPRRVEPIRVPIRVEDVITAETRGLELPRLEYPPIIIKIRVMTDPVAEKVHDYLEKYVTNNIKITIILVEGSPAMGHGVIKDMIDKLCVLTAKKYFENQCVACELFNNLYLPTKSCSITSVGTLITKLGYDTYTGHYSFPNHNLSVDVNKILIQMPHIVIHLFKKIFSGKSLDPNLLNSFDDDDQIYDLVKLDFFNDQVAMDTKFNSLKFIDLMMVFASGFNWPGYDQYNPLDIQPILPMIFNMLKLYDINTGDLLAFVRLVNRNNNILIGNLVTIFDLKKLYITLIKLTITLYAANIYSIVLGVYEASQYNDILKTSLETNRGDFSMQDIVRLRREIFGSKCNEPLFVDKLMDIITMTGFENAANVARIKTIIKRVFDEDTENKRMCNFLKNTTGIPILPPGQIKINFIKNMANPDASCSAHLCYNTLDFRLPDDISDPQNPARMIDFRQLPDAYERFFTFFEQEFTLFVDNVETAELLH
jgi:hypothetical protein